jgi:hypothetical protein
MKWLNFVMAFVSSLLVAACHSPTDSVDSSRSPTPEEWRRGVAIAEEYALRELAVPQDQLAKLKPDAGRVRARNGQETLSLDFFDPKKFPETRFTVEGQFIGMYGGFPSFFVVEIDLQTWRVSGHYASRE